MPKSPFDHASFITSAPALEFLPPDTGSEIAFIGRSNSGKSSAINSITCIKNLARSSKTPGRTQAINFFAVGENARFVDLPGYGYAKVPLKIRERWQDTTEQYLQTRQSLKGLVLIMDIRHPLKESDLKIIQWATYCELPLHILLSKSDKLSHGGAVAALHHVEKELANYKQISIQPFSSLDKTGIEETWSVLGGWLNQ
ncbi:MAG: yihA [Gammaproteobacteria bacterium]|jgi:GTP-binding protein|nr:yihA [Gammaproteobacteria bacterium]